MSTLYIPGARLQSLAKVSLRLSDKRMCRGLLVTSLMLNLIHSAWCLTTQPRNYIASGEARYYDVATGAQTTCGGYHSSSDKICAAGRSVFGQGRRCGQSLVIYYGSKRTTCILDDSQYQLEVKEFIGFWCTDACMTFSSQNVQRVGGTLLICLPPCSRHLHHYRRECCEYVDFKAHKRRFTGTLLEFHHSSSRYFGTNLSDTFQ
ncbi:hypothetical protein PtB15_7B307 [Puccinia triticina]|nr:hypothetical protein PtB15_7B307 [Puccinia triticina]